MYLIYPIPNEVVVNHIFPFLRGYDNDMYLVNKDYHKAYNNNVCNVIIRNSDEDFHKLTIYHNLRCLELRNVVINTLIQLVNLEHLILWRCTINNNIICKQLKKFECEYTHNFFSSISFPILEDLYVFIIGGKIYPSDIEKYTGLKKIHIRCVNTYNKFDGLINMKKFVHLEKIKMQGMNIKNIKYLKKLKSLSLYNTDIRLNDIIHMKLDKLEIDKHSIHDITIINKINCDNIIVHFSIGRGEYTCEDINKLICKNISLSILVSFMKKLDLNKLNFDKLHMENLEKLKIIMHCHNNEVGHFCDNDRVADKDHSVCGTFCGHYVDNYEDYFTKPKKLENVDIEFVFKE